MIHPPIEAFPVRDVAPKPWGREILIAQTADYIGKIMFMRAGASGPLQYHERKDETFYLHAGLAKVTRLDASGAIETITMQPGEAFHIPPFAVHQVEAVEDCVIFEASTPVFDDRVAYVP